MQQQQQATAPDAQQREMALRQQMLAQQQAMQQAQAEAAAEAEARARAEAEGGMMGWIRGVAGGGGGGTERSSAKGSGAAADDGGDLSSVLQTGLSRFSRPTNKTDVFERACYAWQPSTLEEGLSDEAIVAGLKHRLAYVHTTAAQALAACVLEPNVATKPHNFGSHGVDVAVLRAFAAQLLYNLTEARAASFLLRASGAQKVPIVSVPKFLELFKGADGKGGGGSAKHEERIAPVNYHVDKLTNREQKLLLTMRDYLFEQHGQMKNMFKRCDPDNSGYH